MPTKLKIQYCIKISWAYWQIDKWSSQDSGTISQVGNNEYSSEKLADTRNYRIEYVKDEIAIIAVMIKK